MALTKGRFQVIVKKVALKGRCISAQGAMSLKLAPFALAACRSLDFEENLRV